MLVEVNESFLSWSPGVFLTFLHHNLLSDFCGEKNCSMSFKLDGLRCVTDGRRWYRKNSAESVSEVQNDASSLERCSQPKCPYNLSRVVDASPLKRAEPSSPSTGCSVYNVFYFVLRHIF